MPFNTPGSSGLTDTERKLVRFGAEDVEVVEREQVYRGFFKIERFLLRHRLFRGGWSKLLRRELVRRGDAVGVLLYDPRERVVVLVEQFRIGAIADQPWMVELIAGVIEAGESPEEVARREAQEEAGADVDHLQPICSCYLSPGGCDELVYLFYAEVDSTRIDGVHGLAGEGEDIRVVKVHIEEIVEMLEKDRLRNATLIIALRWLLTRV